MAIRLVFILALTISNVLLAAAALRPPTVSAGLYCAELLRCTGDAGCWRMGYLSGCTIFCEDNTYVLCPPRIKPLSEVE